MEVRELQPDEWGAWLRLRELLWPDTTREELVREQEEIGADPARNAVFVAVHGGAEIIGFVEVSLREWAEGCSTHPVGYIEAWYVEPDHRRSGIGRRLIESAEEWALASGCTEMGSDAELGNEVSRRGHLALGYAEVTRLVLFGKRIVD
jgi:aminoglycoside 6'-N-acetyltransferase I